MDEIGASKVTGEEDRYSHTDLYDFQANVEGARAVFDSLEPILKVRAPSVAAGITKGFADMSSALAPYRAGDGWVLYTTVKPAERRDLSRVSRQAGRAAFEDVGHRRAMSRPLSRRRLLELAGVGGVAAVAAGSGGVLVARGGESTDTGTGGTVPFYGDHQAGILTPQQHHLQFASYDVTAANAAELRDLLGSWTGLAARLTRGDDPGSGGGEFAPPDDTGEAGGLDPARLTLTVGFGPGLFDDRFGLAGKRPPELADLPRFEKDELDPAQSGGDICVQACSNDPQVAFHAIRNLTRDGRGGASLRWLQKGFLSPTDGGRRHAAQPDGLQGRHRQSRPRQGRPDGPRTSGPHPAPASAGWPAAATSWPARSGSGSSNGIAPRSASRRQFVGRVKDSGAPLGGTAEHEDGQAEQARRRLAHPARESPHGRRQRTRAHPPARLQLRRGHRRASARSRAGPLLPRLPAGPAPPVRLDPDAARCQRPAQRVPLPHRQRDLRDPAGRPAGRLHRQSLLA